MGYQSIKQLIDFFEAFEQETGSQDMGSFALWLQTQTTEGAAVVQALEMPSGIHFQEPIANRITREVGKMSNFAKHYIRKVTKETPLAGWNDMVAIIVLFYTGDHRKTELIQMALMELSPGMEVIRRLLRLGLIEEFPDPDDGRAKRVKLTAAGREMYVQVEQQLNKVSQIIVGNLTASEQQQFALLLEKLDHFHTPIWTEDGDSELDTILSKYVLPRPTDLPSVN